MATLIELPAEEIESVSEPDFPGILEDFFQSIAAADEAVLLLDFDGTLAPFRVDPAKSRPWAGITDLLGRIQEAGSTRLAIVTGRPAREVASQLGMSNPPEIWGLHGAERLKTDGLIEEEELVSDQQAKLDDARAIIHAANLGVRIEDKRNAVVVHWRGKSHRSVNLACDRALKLLSPYANEAGMKLMQFDGGIELRAGRDKGDAVRMILSEIPSGTPVAYLGDDITDEDAFQALAGQGLGVLVRKEWRPSAALYWLRPPVELRRFLSTWLQTTQRKG